MQTLADHLRRAGQLCDTDDADDPEASARAEFRRLVATLVEVAGRHSPVRMSPPSEAAPRIVLLRTLGKLAERTSGTNVILDERSGRRLDDLERELVCAGSIVRGRKVTDTEVARESRIERSLDCPLGCHGGGSHRRGLQYGL